MVLRKILAKDLDSNYFGSVGWMNRVGLLCERDTRRGVVAEVQHQLVPTAPYEHQTRH